MSDFGYMALLQCLALTWLLLAGQDEHRRERITPWGLFCLLMFFLWMLLSVGPLLKIMHIDGG